MTGSFEDVAREAAAELAPDLGDKLPASVEAVLAYGDPGEGYLWGRDQYERLVLETWDRLLGPERALKRARKICESMWSLGQMPKRRAALVATYLFARAGEHENAIKCLEVALCKLPVPEDRRTL